jgi:lysophospholipase L1-like esterase
VRLRLKVLMGALVAVLAGGLSACNPVPSSYVALGDSFTAGPGITPQDTATPGCLRSGVNYPSLIAPGLDTEVFRDVSCSGARTRHMTEAQDVDPDPDNPPQFSALDRGARVVTLGIGGNDIGFSEVAVTCVELGVRDPNGSPCRDFYNGSGSDELADRIAALAPRLEAVLDGIAARSPAAKVFTVGYPAILPETTDAFELCQPFLPVARGDVAYLRDDVQKRLNATIHWVTASRGKVFVDTYGPSIGRDACRPPTMRWVEPVVPAADAAPVHPNRDGMRGMAEAVRAAMRANGVRVG